MVLHFHDGIEALVQTDGEYSKPFLVTNGVKKCCVMNQHCSARCFLPCLKMHLRARILFSYQVPLCWQVITPKEVASQKGTDRCI